MKKPVMIFLAACIAVSLQLTGQEIPVTEEQQLENLADITEAETEDDTWLQELSQLRKNPVDLNAADADELRRLRIISEVQIVQFIAYRNLLGRLLSVYELQAIPYWDIATIKKIAPYVFAGNSISVKEDIAKWFREGEHSLLLRVSQVLERSRGFLQTDSGRRYLGSRQRIFFRHRYNYKNLLQFGIVGDKDAGEQFFKGAQRMGFDFYSVHLFARKIGVIQSLAIGDFTVNMGQGLIHWQSLAFKKSVDVMGIKRQSSVLRPYNAAGEFYFHRGAGITLRKGKWESTLFASFRKLSGNFAADTMNSTGIITSFLTMGYHRTVNEIEDRNNTSQFSAGGNISFRANRWHIGFNSVHYRFSTPLQRRDEPYNLYAIAGDKWSNFSVDYSYTFRNLHFFGEAAVDKNFNQAFVNGMTMSVDATVDIAFLHRKIRPGYQSLYGNAFTENSLPVNETGFYTGISIKPLPGWRLDAYADLFTFPWLKYLADAPGYGKDFLIQLTYLYGKQAEVYTRFRTETKQANQSGNTTVYNYLVAIPRQSWRTQVSYKAGGAATIRARLEMLWYDKQGENRSTGFLSFIDYIYKPMLKRYAGGIRLQYFETGDYNSRIYAYENDVLYSFSIPAFYDKGFRYYINASYDINKRTTFWLRLARLTYKDKNNIGSGLDEISGNSRTEARFQLRWLF